MTIMRCLVAINIETFDVVTLYTVNFVFVSV